MTEPLILATGLTVRLGGVAVVDGVSLSLRAGEIVALVGPNGAGKTTLLRALAGIEGAAQGHVVLGGRDLRETSLRDRAKAIAYLPQGHVFHWPMSAAATVALGRLPYADAFTQFSETDRAAVSASLSATGLDALADRPVTNLSGGERARVALARALATQARILLADEPTVALDPRQQLVVMELLRQTARSGNAVLAVVHDLGLAARFCDRVIVMVRGRIVADAPPAEALSPQRLAEAFGIEAVIVDTGDGHVPVARRPL